MRRARRQAKSSPRGRRPPAEARAAAKSAAVFLVGFMGAGKTKVGEALAACLGWRFIDLDGRIESRQKRRIANIFREHGESEFRRAETAELRHVLKELRSEGEAVVALGGGAFVQPGNAALLTGGRCVFLDAPVEELWRRAHAEEGVRPLAISENHFRQLYAARRARYMEADHHVRTAGKTVEQVAAEIREWLQLGTSKGERV